MKPFTVTMPDGKVYTGRADDDATADQVNAQVTAKWRAEQTQQKAAAPPQSEGMRIVKMLVGMEQPQSLIDWAILVGSTVPAVELGAAGLTAAAARTAWPWMARAVPYLGRALAPAAITSTRSLLGGEGTDMAL